MSNPDALQIKLLRQPNAVGIIDLADEDLVADADELCLHKVRFDARDQVKESVAAVTIIVKRKAGSCFTLAVHEKNILYADADCRIQRLRAVRPDFAPGASWSQD